MPFDPALRLSEHFTLGEFVRSETAERSPGLVAAQEAIPAACVDAAAHLCATVLEPLRAALGGLPVRISSGYRSPAVNRAVGGAGGSQHTKGEAADLDLDAGWLSDPRSTAARMDLRSAVHSRCGRAVLEHPNAMLFALLVLRLHEWGVDQLIHELGAPGAPAWVHASASRTSARGQILVASRGARGVAYEAITEEAALRLVTR